MKWNDNSTVTVVSNYCGVNPIHKVERRVKKGNKNSVDQPHLIHMYNKGMKGVDVFDRMLSSYGLRRRSKKWWWNIFANLLNMAAVAAFRFYQHVGGSTNMSHTMFRREIARARLTKKGRDSEVIITTSQSSAIRRNESPSELMYSR